MNKEIQYFVAFSANLEIGAKTLAKISQCFSSMEEAWHAPISKLKEKGLSDKIINSILKSKSQKKPDEEMKKLDRFKIKAITKKDKFYPSILKQIPDAPELLYYKGNIECEKEVNLAVVGSRKFSSYGEKAVEKIIKPLCGAGILIVSGLALGIDALAHKEALKAQGRTFAVLGNGLDSIYPSSNRYLAEEIVKNNGALISEFPIGTPSFKQNFPFRNRIIAGLSRGTLVIEAAASSGSLITAGCALDYNREVFAVPGSIFSSNSEGPNNLIKMGAKTVTGTEDILSELNIEIAKNHQKVKEIIPDTKEEKIIIETVGEDSLHIDKIAKISKLDIVKLNQTLILMEMKGKIKNLGANVYSIVK